MTDLHELLSIMYEQGSSDLHISTGIPPTIRVDGELQALDDMSSLSPAETKSLVYSVLTDAQKHLFEETNELDFSFGVKGLCRFRGNAFIQRGAVGAVFRTIPYQILSFKELGLPVSTEKFAERPMGLVLVTGPTGSGKSTTLAALIDKINRERRAHIITIEDPIEFLHEHRSCVVNQREVHSDTNSFSMALRHVLRQDPDVILIGEMRDLETIEAALTVAETGHLVFATLHTNSCAQTINRIIDVFPPHQQTQVRTQLSFVLEGVLTQQLIPKANGRGRVVAVEIMVPTAAIRNLIREDKIHQIYSQIQIGQEKFGTRTMNQSLLDLYQRRHISRDEAIRRSPNLEEFTQMMARVQVGKTQQKSRR
ncbi:type IV pili twitching motility protein PilT [candidate division KSB3 bacterium]|uniref:Type IV pili twitching motility protein PilT n=1 Tax=candidate division KSB3 bacterium TaxID=2044937 RepID=A0A2G6KIR9_9BACT|nr:MAG: type IV pili twitching motility protein PilT [candidate division KSB3 bacterium]